MFAAASPHAQILLAPWRQRGNQHDLPLVALTLALLLCAAPTVVMATLRPAQHALWLGTATVVAMLQGLWLVHFASLQRQNHPHAARLVPGHLQRLREALIGLWLAITLTTAALLGSVFGNGLAWGSAAAAVMLLTAVMMRHPLLWSVFWIVPVTERWWGRSTVWRWLRGEAVAQYAERPWVLSLAVLLVAALMLGAMLKAGGGRHASAYAEQERVRLGMRRAARGGSTLRYQGRIGGALVRFFSAPYRAWMRHLLATARPTPRSVLARAELAFGAYSHWTAQAMAGGLFFGIGSLALIALTAVTHTDVWQMPTFGKVGLAVGLTSFAVNPLIGLRSSLYDSRREQALMMLVPGMPRGAALNRQLARRQLMQALSAWLIAAVVIVSMTAMDDAVIGYVLAGLPAGLLLLRNWAALPAPHASSMAAPIFAVLAGGTALYAAMRWLQVPAVPLIAVVVTLTAALGVWRWRRLARYPQAFPVGRLG